MESPSSRQRAELSLLGLRIGDALGEMFSSRFESILERIPDQNWPPGPWFHTDDGEMALSVLEVLKARGTIDQDALASAFMIRYARDPDRGYGKATRIQLRAQLAGGDWRTLSADAFGGRGSMGNGSAMRVAPVGAWFAGDYPRIVEEATASAIVTHTHPEAVAGAIAIAVAASFASELQGVTESTSGQDLLDCVLRWTPPSETRKGIEKAAAILSRFSVAHAVAELGRGALITCPDTVPFTLWAAARYLGNYTEAIAETISAGGDCDTNAAIVGGIVACAVGQAGIPEEWKSSLEPLAPFYQ